MVRCASAREILDSETLDLLSIGTQCWSRSKRRNAAPCPRLRGEPGEQILRVQADIEPVYVEAAAGDADE